MKEFTLAVEGMNEHNNIFVYNAWLAARLTHCDPKRFPRLSKLTYKKRVAPSKSEIENMRKTHKELVDKVNRLKKKKENG